MTEDNYCSLGLRDSPTAPHIELVLLGPPAYESPNEFVPPSKSTNLFMVITVTQLILAALLLYSGISCEIYAGGYHCSYYSIIWMSSLCLLNLPIGVIAAITRCDRLLSVHISLCVAVIVAGIATGVISVLDYITIGTTQWCYENNVFCIIAEHDPRRIFHIGTHFAKSDFVGCVWQFKIGLSIVTLSIFGVIFIVFLNILSIILSSQRIKRWSKFRRR
ncbi:hypothetical protein RB195_012239 [Necator americanus]|uniref:G-protein coupled receptors family 1 profile domain-containing protein n=1 Tax=Necator americanus TaxID=51031 RepID=A0ABR1D656_NECAM